MSLCPNIAGSNKASDEDSPRNKYRVYSREFQSMLDGLDEEGCMEESVHVAEKKRRLGVDQVKTLEKSFEVENKLEPERKLKLAEELGLQPRQVAVWFQNRRARWKTKQIERDYGVLKANYEALKLKFDTLQRDNEGLSKEIRELKAKLNEENTASDVSAKIETGAPSTDDEKAVDENYPPPPSPSLAYARSTEDLMDNIYDSFENYNNGGVGSSDSDSSAILNEGTSPNRGAISSPGVFAEHQQLMLSSSSSMNCFQFSKAASYQTQFVKMEEHEFFSGEACNFFSDEQAPSLQWYCPDPWT